MNALEFYQGLGTEPVPLAAADAPSAGSAPQANVEIRWPGMSQNNGYPGIGWEAFFAGGVSGPFNPFWSSRNPLVPPSSGRAESLGDPNLTNPSAFSNGQPSGVTNSAVPPRPWTDMVYPRPLDLNPPATPRVGWNPGQPERNFAADDVLSGSRTTPPFHGIPAPQRPVVVYQDAYPPAITYRGGLEGQGMPGYVGAMQAGEQPPTMSAEMGSHSVTVQRRSGDTFSPIPSLGQVSPGEAIRFRSDGGNLPFDTVKFRVLDAMGNLTFEFEANLNSLLSGWVDTVAPTLEGPYTLTAEVRSFPFLAFTHFASVQFVVNKDAPTPPAAPPQGKDWFGDLKGIIIALAVLAGVVLVAPRVLPRRD